MNKRFLRKSEEEEPDEVEEENDESLVSVAADSEAEVYTVEDEPVDAGEDTGETEDEEEGEPITEGREEDDSLSSNEFSFETIDLRRTERIACCWRKRRKLTMLL